MSVEKKTKADKRVVNKKKTLKEKIKEFYIVTVIALIVVTFLLGGALVTGADIFTGLNSFMANFKVKKNEDGTYSWPEEKIRRGNSVVVGAVRDKLITFDENSPLRYQFEYIYQNEQIPQQYKPMYLKQAFDQEINKAVGKIEAEKSRIYYSANYVMKSLRDQFTRDGKFDRKSFNMASQLEKSQRFDSIRDDSIFYRWQSDMFQNMLVSDNEVIYNNSIENWKLKVEYVFFSYDDIDDETLNSYFTDNKDDFAEIKAEYIVFASEDEAKKNLAALQADADNFTTLCEDLVKSEKAKLSGKLLDGDWFHYEKLGLGDEFITEAKSVQIGSVSSKPIPLAESWQIFRILDRRTPDLDDAEVKNRIKEKYLDKEKFSVEEKRIKQAQDFYNSLTENDLKKAAEENGYSIETSGEFSFLKTAGAPKEVRIDDEKFFTKVFAASLNEILGPIEITIGVIVVKIIDELIPPELDDEKNKQEKDRIASSRSYRANDNYYNEKKKDYKVVNNYDLIFGQLTQQ